VNKLKTLNRFWKGKILFRRGGGPDFLGPKVVSKKRENEPIWREGIWLGKKEGGGTEKRITKTLPCQKKTPPPVEGPSEKQKKLHKRCQERGGNKIPKPSSKGLHQKGPAGLIRKSGVTQKSKKKMPEKKEKKGGILSDGKVCCGATGPLVQLE